MTIGEMFQVVVTMTKAIKGEHIVYAYGLDADGFEVIWTASPADWDELAAHALAGDQVNVQGHDIYAYSGEYGPWGPAARPQKDV